VITIKTKTWVKVVFILQAIYTFCCVSSILCSVAHLHFHSFILSSLLVILFYGWGLNPVGLIFLFSSAKQSEENRKLIGKKSLWFIAFFLIDTALYLCAAFLFVEATGGV